MIMERETDESPQEAFGDDGPPPQQEMSIQPNDHSPIIDASIEYATSIGALPPPQEFRVHETTDDDDEAGSMPALRPDWEKQPSPLLQDEHQAKRCSRESQILILIVALLMLPLGITAAVVVSRRNQNQNQNQNQLPLDDSSSVGTTSLWKPEERLGEIKAILSTVGVSDPLTFLEPTSPQARALDWLVYEDTLLTPNDVPDVIVQRYVAILFAYAGNAELWRGVEPWFELTGSHECSFPGLDCNPDNNHIDSIQLLRRRVSGTIPEEIGLLTDLKILVLGMNHLEGSFPDSMFQKLTKLQILDLALNKFSSTLSENIGRLTDLNVFQVAQTSLSGSLPRSLSNLTNLETLNLLGTAMEGPVMDIIIELPKLRDFDCSYSLFTGSIPTELGLLTDLEVFFAMLTEMDLTVPTEIGMLTNLEIFAIESNKLLDEGVSIPSEIGNLNRLRTLTMQGKTFEGTLPTEIGHLTRLEELSFQGCRYSGELPSELGLLTNLEKLLIDRNNFKGTIPVEFDNIADTLNLFLFSSNHFEGTLPYGFCKSDVSLHLDCQVECDCCTDSDCAP